MVPSLSVYARMPLQDFRIELFVPEAAHRVGVYRHLVADLEALADEYEDMAAGPDSRGLRLVPSHALSEAVHDRLARAERALAEVGYRDEEGLGGRRDRAKGRLISAWVKVRAMDP